MKDIKCQACKGRKNEGSDYKGCSTCGGHGVVFEVLECLCGNKYYSKPGAYAIYEGKKFKTVDGLTITYGKGGVISCSKCEDK